MRTHNMKKIAVPAVLVGFGLSIALASACSNGGGNGGATTGTTSNTVGVTTGAMTTTSVTTSTNAATTTNASSSTGMMFPTAPTVGAEIDRMGRPAINTALNHAFDATCTGTTCAPKDMYNQDTNEAMWATKWAPEFAKNLAILDALDGTCGNQLFYAKPTAATSYSTIAGALADDRLYLDTSTATCTQYLGAELHTLVPATFPADCGGRKLDYKVMDITYSALAAGALTGVSNGITMNDATFTATFPYEAAPH